MLKLIKFLVYRIKNNKSFLITYLILMPIVIGIAVYFTNNISYNLQIGIVGTVDTVKNDEIQYIYLDSIPATSELVLNRYDAIIIQKDNDLEVISTKGEEFDQALLLLVSGEITTLQDSNNQRGAASNILGFLMMVILLLGVQMYKFYFDERNGINKRIMSTSTHYAQYMLSHFVVVFSFLFIPALVVICGIVLALNISLMMAMWQFILVLFLLCFFATSFGLWINSLAKTQEESMMFGNMFAIVGSIISGGFVQVTNNQIFTNIIQIFPQRQIMSLLEALENQTALPLFGIVYVISISATLMLLGIVIEKRKLPTR